MHFGKTLKEKLHPRAVSWILLGLFAAKGYLGARQSETVLVSESTKFSKRAQR